MLNKSKTLAKTIESVLGKEGPLSVSEAYGMIRWFQKGHILAISEAAKAATSGEKIDWFYVIRNQSEFCLSKKLMEKAENA